MKRRRAFEQPLCRWDLVGNQPANTHLVVMLPGEGWPRLAWYDGGQWWVLHSTDRWCKPSHQPKVWAHLPTPKNLSFKEKLMHKFRSIMPILSIASTLSLFLKWASFVLLITVMTLGCVPAFGADMIPAHQVAAPAFGTALQAFLQQTVFPVISALVLGLVSLVLTRLGKKYKVQSLTEENNFLFRLAAQGVALAEERAAKLAGSVNQLTGSQKLDIAVGHLLSFAPSIKPEQAQDIVHSVLAQIPGTGATGEAVTLLPQEGGYSIPIPGVPVTEEIFDSTAPAQ